MIRHYFKLAKKVLIKNKYYTVINVFGLVCGMLSVLIIAKYIGGSLYVDNFHVKKDRIYTIAQEESSENNASIKGETTYWGLGEIVNQYPEVLSVSRYNYHVESLVISEEDADSRISFIENKIFSTDSNFLKIFSFPLIFGNPETALSRVNSIVITKSTSQKYFGTTNALGKVLTIRVSWGKETMYEVTGVVEDIPKNSKFRFDFLVHSSPLSTEYYWDVPAHKTYVLLSEKIESPKLETKLTSDINEIAPLEKTNKKVVISLEPFAKKQLSSIEYMLAVVGLFILLISWVNFINQSIGQSYGRFKEIGILRVMGATVANLKSQFYFESGLICLTSLIISVVVYLGLEPYLQSFTNGHLLPLIGDPGFINLAFLSIFIIGTVLVAAIPSMVLFSHNLSSALQKGFGGKIGSLRLRKLLLIFQFSISTILMICIFVIMNQLDFMSSKNKGINIENTIIVKSPMEKGTWESKTKKLRLFKEKCKELSFLAGITSSSTIPGEEYRRESFLSLDDPNEKKLVYLNGVDDRFLDLYEIRFVAGGNFIPNARWRNRKGIILNESAARALGIIDFDKMMPTKLLLDGDKELELMGIVENYHKTSLRYEIRPMAFQFNDNRGHFSLKVHSLSNDYNDLQKKVSGIENVWAQVYPDNPFDYFLLAERFKSQDKEDIYFAKLFKIFTALSIVISCLGLFGFSLLVSTKRLREIGVRKIFGASSFNILVMFTKGYLGSLSVATIIGIPIAYSLMTIWLKNYAYKVEIGFLSISLAVLSLTLIFLFTVLYHTIKSSTANPVTILRG
ncbi:FtsX-like permease family protein [Fulvivirga sp. M361]|nr:FtsX-like permease family protein [Fulvivirga sp. M361]